MKRIDYLIITVLTLISPLLYGYYFGVLDHHHYLPYINKLLDPELYTSDYYFSQPHYLYSLFNWVIAGLSRWLNMSLSWVFLIVYLASLWLLNLAVYYLALTLFCQRTVSYLALGFWLLPKWAAQIGYLTHQFYFVSRDLSLGLALLALSFIIQGKFTISAWWVLIAALVNPTIAVPVAILWVWLWLKKRPIFPAVAWMELMQKRGTYSFPLNWSWTGWGNMALFLSLLVFAAAVLKQKWLGFGRRVVWPFLIICGGLFVVHIVFSGMMPVPWLIQFQLLRSVNYIFVIALIVFAAAVHNLWIKGSWRLQLAIISSLAGVYFWGDHLTGWHFLAIWLLPAMWWLESKLKRDIRRFKVNLDLILTAIIGLHLVVNLFFIKPKVRLPDYWHYPGPLIEMEDYGDWLSVQLWVKNNTVKESIFLTPPNLSGFRSFSQRSIVADNKDGGLIFYSPEYAAQWQNRVEKLRGYNRFGEKDFLSISQDYPFDYLVVSSSHQPLNWKIVYRNPSFLIYQL